MYVLIHLHLTPVIYGHILQLHKVLSQLLPKPEVEEILSQIMELFSEKLPEAFKSIDPHAITGEGRECIINDITFLITTTRSLGPLRERGHNLERHFRDRFGL